MPWATQVRYFHIVLMNIWAWSLCECKPEKEIGNGLYQLFINKSAAYLQTKAEVMAWETLWWNGWFPARGIERLRLFSWKLRLRDSDLTYVKKHDQKIWSIRYDPNRVLYLWCSLWFRRSESEKTAVVLKIFRSYHMPPDSSLMEYMHSWMMMTS